MISLQINTISLTQSASIKSIITGWIISGFIGAILCIILTAIFYPWIEDKFQGLFVRRLNFLGYSNGKKLAGIWNHQWHVVSDHFKPINELKNIKIKQFGKRIFAQYNVIDKNGKTYTYQMFGKVDKDMYVTGVWKDKKSGLRYHGCFQLSININEQSMNGYWTGISSGSQIKTGLWEWFRIIN